MSDTENGWVRRGRHPVNISHLVMGMAFLGLLAIWAVVQADLIDNEDIRWLLPVPWVLAGAAGLTASVLAGRRTPSHQVTGWLPADEPGRGWVDDWTDPSETAPSETAPSETAPSETAPSETAQPAAQTGGDAEDQGSPAAPQHGSDESDGSDGTGRAAPEDDPARVESDGEDGRVS